MRDGRTVMQRTSYKIKEMKGKVRQLTLERRDDMQEVKKAKQKWKMMAKQGKMKSIDSYS